MKVYTAVKSRRHKYSLATSEKSNLQQLASNIVSNSVSQSLATYQPHRNHSQQQAVSLSRQLVSNIHDPYQCMLLYPLILDCNLAYPPDAILLNTTFNEELHSILSIYLHKCSSFTYLRSKSRKLIDVFCLYMGQRHPQLVEQWIHRGESLSLGQWFSTHCLSRFFSHYFTDKQSFTLFITRFMLHGVAYLFIAAKDCLQLQQDIKSAPEIDQCELNLIKYGYIHKFKLEQLKPLN